MLGSGIAMWQICCTTSFRIVVSLSVGGVVQHVRVVECGANARMRLKNYKLRATTTRTSVLFVGCSRLECSIYGPEIVRMSQSANNRLSYIVHCLEYRHDRRSPLTV